MEGVLDVGINFVTDKVYVKYDPLVLARSQVRRAIEDANDEPNSFRLKDDQGSKHDSHSTSAPKSLRGRRRG
jgi:hypothetical protein